MKEIFCILLGINIALAVNNRCHWDADKQWYQPLNSTLRYHTTPKTMEYSSCSTECVKLKGNVSFATMNETVLQQFQLVKRLRSVLLWVVHSVPSTPAACSFVLKGQLLLSNNCYYKFRCLCQRQTNFLANATMIISDTQMSINKNASCQHKSKVNTWINSTGLMYEYLVTKNLTKYDSCSEMCGHYGNQSKPAVLNTSYDLGWLELLRKIMNLQTWIYKDGEANKNLCHFAYKMLVLNHTNCNHSMKCLCQRRLGSTIVENKTSSNVTIPVYTTGIRWVLVKDRHYLIYGLNVSFTAAKDFCKTENAALLSFTSPVQYIYLSNEVSLNGEYWVEDKVKSTHDKCLVLDVKNKTSLKFVSCLKKHYSICRRVVDSANVLNRPAFVNLISNMTINRHNTSKMKRKRNSAEDTRVSVKALGSVLGVGVITVVGCLLILNDAHTLSRKKEKLSKNKHLKTVPA